MFEWFTKKARYVIYFARYEVQKLGDSSMQSHHLLLGLVRVGKYTIADFLPDKVPSNFLREVRRKVLDKVGVRPSTKLERVPLSAEAQRILRYSFAAADVLSQCAAVERIHLLVGLLWEEHCVANQILSELGVRLEEIYKHLDPIYQDFSIPRVLSELELNLSIVYKKLGKEVEVLRKSKPVEMEPPIHLTPEDIKFLDNQKLRLE